MLNGFRKLHITKTKINKTITLLTFSDIFTWGLMSAVNAIIGIYLAEKIGVDAVKVVGIGNSIFSITKGLTQIPVGTLIDNIKHDKDDIIALFVGSILMGLPFVFFPLITSEYIFYVLMFVVGLGSSINLVSWRKLFATNIDKHHEGKEYGLYETLMSLSTALFSILAGFIANISQSYFDLVIVLIGVLMISSGVFALLLFKVHDRANE